MPEVIKNGPNNVIERLNMIMKLEGPMTFQKVLLNIAHSQHGLAFIAEQAGVRRETIWRYKTGAARAPFETLVKIIALIGGELVIGRGSGRHDLFEGF